MPKRDTCYCEELHLTHRCRVLVAHFPHSDVLHSLRFFVHSFYTWNGCMGVGRGGAERSLPPWILKILAKKVVFLVSSGKKQMLPLLAPPRKILEKNPSGSPWKNPSDAHVHRPSSDGSSNRVFPCHLIDNINTIFCVIVSFDTLGSSWDYRQRWCLCEGCWE